MRLMGMSKDSASSESPVPVDSPPISGVYQDQMTALSHGLALWNPNPLKEIYDKVSIGDVGYLHEGSFIRMFNVMLPWSHDSNRTLGEPEPYQSLDCGRFANTFKRQFDRVKYCSRHVSAETNACNGHIMTPEDVEDVTYTFRNRGALLSLPNGGHHEDVIRAQAFQDYIQDYADSWFTWARKNRLAVERVEDLILVSGCTLVTSWAAAAFVDNTIEAEISLTSRTLSNVRTSFVWGNVRGHVSYHNSRFDPQNPPTMADQCVFIRGFRAKRTLFWIRPIRIEVNSWYDDPNIGVLDAIMPSIKNENTELSPYRHRTLQRTDGLFSNLDTIEPPINHENPQLLPYRSSPTLHSNGDLCNHSFMTSPSYNNSSIGVPNYAVEIRHADAFDTTSISHDNGLTPVDNAESLTVDAVNILRENDTSLVNKNSPAILRDPLETNQMTTKRKEGRFRWKIGSHLFRRMTKAGFALLGTPILSSRAPVPSSPPSWPLPTPTHATAPPPHLTSTPSFHVASSHSGMPAHGAAQHNYEMTTLLLERSAVASERMPSQDSTSSRRRRDDSDYYPPPLSASDPYGQEMDSNLFKFRPRIGASPQLRRSLSMDTESPRSHSPSRMTRTSSTNLLGQARHPPGTQVESGLSGTGQIPADRQERRPFFPSTLQSLLSNDFRFRILVVGKPGSGKSSLIKTIFNVDMSRAPTNVSGMTAEFRPRDNRRLIVHECSAFGPRELQAIRDSITMRNHKSRPASERLHAIWICLPMSDVVRGQFDDGLKLLLDTGVPLVIVFTMFDLIIPNVSSHGNEFESAKATAYMAWEGHCRTLFGNVRAEIVSTRPRFRDLIVKLVATTNDVIMGHSRDISASPEAQRTQSRMSPVTLAWSVSQRASCSINIQAAIEVGQSRYWRRLGSSEVFAGQTLANCVEVIRSDIVGVWNLPDVDRYLSSKAFEVGISHIVQDLSRPPIGASSRPRQSDTQGTGAAWLNERYENRNVYICLVVAYIVDLTIILCDFFDRHGNVSLSGAQSIMGDFASSSLKTTIHAEICHFLKTAPLFELGFEYQDSDIVLAKIIDLIRRNCSSSDHK